MPRKRARKIFGNGPLRQNLLFGYGMLSDDTEQTCIVLQSLLTAKNHSQIKTDGQYDLNRFRANFAKRLRYWLLGLPSGIGLGTLRSILKLWCGIPPTRSGANSAGNGSAMRSAVLGVIFSEHPKKLLEFTETSSKITHADVRATEGAIAIAVAAAYACQNTKAQFQEQECLTQILSHIKNEELKTQLQKIAPALKQKMSCVEFADSLGLAKGVSGYVCHTVPVALFCWLKHRNDFRKAVTQTIQLGGDTDTVAAIVGALTGITAGADQIPNEWVSKICEWPRSVTWMKQLTTIAASNFDYKTPEIPFLKLLFRNILFIGIVLFHGFRRLAPPY